VEGEVGAAVSEQRIAALKIYWEAFIPSIYFGSVV
jgi:hypothetical protein